MQAAVKSHFCFEFGRQRMLGDISVQGVFSDVDDLLDQDPLRDGFQEACGILTSKTILVVLSEKIFLMKVLHQWFRLHSINICCILQNILPESSQMLHFFDVGQNWDRWLFEACSGKFVRKSLVFGVMALWRVHDYASAIRCNNKSDSRLCCEPGPG